MRRSPVRTDRHLYGADDGGQRATTAGSQRPTRVYLQLSGEGPGLAATVPASQVQGGGTISSVIVVPVGPMEETDVGVSATATDLAGNESERSEQKTVRIDRLPPAAPH